MGSPSTYCSATGQRARGPNVRLLVLRLPARALRSARSQGTPSVAQLRWQKPADGSDSLAKARTRWHRTPSRPAVDLLFSSALIDRLSDLAICTPLPLLSSSTPPRFRLHTYASRRSRSAQLKIENRTEGRWEAAVAVAVSIARGHDACYPFTAVGAADGATVTDERRTDYYLSAAEQVGESAGSLGWRRRHRAWLPRQGHGAAPGLCRAVARLAALLAPRRGGNAARPRANPSGTRF